MRKESSRKLKLHERRVKSSKLREFEQSILELIKETSTNLPLDVRKTLKKVIEGEIPDSKSLLALKIMAINIDMAYANKSPICQDTGMPTFNIRLPLGLDQAEITRGIRSAIKKATKAGILRPNTVDPLCGESESDNIGKGSPIIHFEQWNREEIEVKLILKGGGCENKSIQYSLPCELPYLGVAERTIDGVRKCLLHAVWQAQGHGCSVGAIGVALGGDRSSGYYFAKQQLLRPINDINPDPELAKLENYIVEYSNKLNIGTMGFGGNSTLMACKIGAFHRLPASFFVTVSYNCWAYRRLGVILDADTGAIKKWLYRMPSRQIQMSDEEWLSLSDNITRVNLPLSEEKVRSFKIGDVIVLSGIIHTARDAVHRHLVKNDSPVNLEGSGLYHCGPVALNKSGKWTITAAGPTTSIRQEPYQSVIIRKFKPRAIIGKGGMGENTLSALKEIGGVYLSAIGGAAQYYARCIKEVIGVDFLDFGIPEAMWHIRVEDFLAVVTMDANGNNLHKDIENRSAEELSKFA